MPATQQIDSLTIVVPIFNEEPCLDHFKNEMDRFLTQAPVPTTVMFVNDGSTDDSQAMIQTICAADDCYKFIALDKNTGLSTALKAGIDSTESALVGYIDADVQTSPVDFLKFFEFFPQYDLVNGIRHQRNDSVVKKISSRVANTARRVMIDDGIEDTCCPLKVMKTDYARSMPFFIGMHRFIPALVQLQGGSVKQVPVQHFPRYAGTAKYNLRNRLIGPFIDTLAFIWIKKRYIRYRISKKSL
ncbi:MAG: glycosyltransferase [Deltaproteobacteria bacterium]|jgi:glycosyltransferase involved in cell wall biosynthesis|nr:glycosyltransferase [Deltaproteobacteria bacterium]